MIISISLLQDVEGGCDIKENENLSNSNTFEISGSKEAESNIFQENHNDVDFKLLSPVENDSSFCSDSENKLGSSLINGETSVCATDGKSLSCKLIPKIIRLVAQWSSRCL